MSPGVAPTREWGSGVSHARSDGVGDWGRRMHRRGTCDTTSPSVEVQGDAPLRPPCTGLRYDFFVTAKHETCDAQKFEDFRIMEAKP
ncbi:hypothetical protein PIB30_002571 [Stylosanthes scabra]|uniref:Uncharacterized protein n=1 Tax=Stylosanthes scabra TaxID=79078 RepID=A0ABU6YZU0_9FABA|nr:hypothetical protein [Stylosanthes scabra]